MRKLLVFDYNGTARSGKGTIVNFLTSKYADEVTCEETGKDYRAITKVLLDDAKLSVGMDFEQIRQTVDKIPLAELEKIVDSRQQIISQHGHDSLYEETINKLVAGTGQSQLARAAVKAGLKKRVNRLYAAGHYRAVLLDGRNLGPVVKNFNGIELRLRTFVTCSAIEAARRECLRKHIAPDSADGLAILRNLKERIAADAARREDAVKAEPGALNFWRPPRFAGVPIGRFAAVHHQQILFDTTPYATRPEPKQAMLADAEQMFVDALRS